MSGAAPDLSKLRINRDAPPPGVRRAFTRVVLFASIAVVLLAVGFLFLRGGSVPTVQVVTLIASSAGGSPTGGGATSVTANGYFVARTKAAVSAKIAGRISFLNVSEGWVVHQGDVIARLDNADYQAGVGQAAANLATANASLIEASADRDQVKREADRLVSIRAQNVNLVSQQDLDPATSKAAQAEAGVQPAPDRQRATVQVKVSILDHDPRILPEMGAKVDFLEPETARAGTGNAARAAAPPLLRVPAQAVSDSGSSSFVWQVRGGRLTRRV